MENAVLPKAGGDAVRLRAAAVEVMRRTGDVDPRVADIVSAAGSSLKTFYRLFPSKDDLLLAVLDQGLRDLLAFLERGMPAEGGDAAVAAWIEGVLAQARHPDAAAATAPFVRHRAHLAARLPEATTGATDALVACLRTALEPISHDPTRDARAIAQAALGTMERHLLAGTRPTAADVEHLVAFALGGVHRGA